jgi:hypothetical protein
MTAPEASLTTPVNVLCACAVAGISNKAKTATAPMIRPIRISAPFSTWKLLTRTQNIYFDRGRAIVGLIKAHKKTVDIPQNPIV